MANPPFLRRVRLRNYKSIGACDVDLGRFTILVGRNGSGKSNFLDALSFLSDALNTSISNAVDKRGGMRSLLPQYEEEDVSIELLASFRLPQGQAVDYEIAVASRDGEPFNRFEQLVAHENGEARTIFKSVAGKLAGEAHDLSQLKIPYYSLALALFGENSIASGLIDALRQYRVYDPQPNRMRQAMVDIDDAVLEPDGGNAASVMWRLQTVDEGRASRLADFLSVAIDDFNAIGVRAISRRSAESKAIAEAWLHFYLDKDDNRVFSNREVSDGTLRAFAVLLAATQRLRDGNALPLIGIEEPETGLHPAACAAMIEGLREASLASQILLTTHSPDILDNLEDDDVLLVVKNSRQGTQIGPPTQVNLSIIRDHLYSPGELLRMDHLEPSIRTEQLPSSTVKG